MWSKRVENCWAVTDEMTTTTTTTKTTITITITITNEQWKLTILTPEK